MSTKKSNTDVKETKAGHFGDGSYTYRPKERRYILRYKGQTKYVRSEVEDDAKAIKSLQKFRKEVDSGLKPAVYKKLDTYYTEWMETVCRNKWKPSTFDTAEQTYRLYIAKPLGSVQLGRIEAQDIQRLLDATLKDGKSVSTVKHIYVLLKNLFTYAFQVGHIQNNPIDRVSKPHMRDGAEVKKIEVFEDNEVDMLEQVAARKDKHGKPVNKHANLIILMLNTGIRRGELLGLKWTDGCAETYQTANGGAQLDGLPAGKRIGAFPLHSHEYVQQK